MKKSDHVSVGIVAYNTELKVIQNTIESILRSNLDIELIVLCNSPNLIYQEQIKKLCEEKNLRFLGNQPNRGFGYAHNRIMREVHTKWYICSNPDVEINQDSILKLILFGNAHQDAIILSPRILNSEGNVTPLARKHLTLPRWIHRQMWRVLPNLFVPFEIKFDYETSQSIEFVSGCFFAIQSEHFRRLEGFSEDFFLYCEDADLSKRAEKLGKNYYVSNSVIKHYWAKSWTHSPKAVLAELSSLLKYFSRHGFFLNSRNYK